MSVELPDEWAGVVTICWTPSGHGVLEGWHCAVAIDGQVLPGVTALDVHAEPVGPVWAEVTTLVDKNGEPVKGVRDIYVEDGQPKSATLIYLVAEMQLGISERELKRLRST